MMSVVLHNVNSCLSRLPVEIYGNFLLVFISQRKFPFLPNPLGFWDGDYEVMHEANVGTKGSGNTSLQESLVLAPSYPQYSLAAGIAGNLKILQTKHTPPI